MNHEPLVLIGNFTKLSTSKDVEQITRTKQDRRNQSWVDKVEIRRRPSGSSFLTPSAVQLTLSTHPLYEMIGVSKLHYCVLGHIRTAS